MKGSSPLARGLPEFEVHRIHSVRIIPARAGFTCPGRWTPPRVMDHPRSRGVYGPVAQVTEAPEGSSPLARGLRGHARRRRVLARIIPARAGFTPKWGHTPDRTTDHPRSRGVYQTYLLSFHVQFGSSPLARGLRTDFDRYDWRLGIIPARAGFTRGDVFRGS